MGKPLVLHVPKDDPVNTSFLEFIKLYPGCMIDISIARRDLYRVSINRHIEKPACITATREIYYESEDPRFFLDLIVPGVRIQTPLPGDPTGAMLVVFIPDEDGCDYALNADGFYVPAQNISKPQEEDSGMNSQETDNLDVKASGEAFNNTYHKVRAEVPRDAWDRIWKTALEWERQRNKEAVGAPLRDDQVERAQETPKELIFVLHNGLVGGHQARLMMKILRTIEEHPGCKISVKPGRLETVFTLGIGSCVEKDISQRFEAITTGEDDVGSITDNLVFAIQRQREARVICHFKEKQFVLSVYDGQWEKSDYTSTGEWIPDENPPIEHTYIFGPGDHNTAVAELTKKVNELPGCLAKITLWKGRPAIVLDLQSSKPFDSTSGTIWTADITDTIDALRVLGSGRLYMDATDNLIVVPKENVKFVKNVLSMQDLVDVTRVYPGCGVEYLSSKEITVDPTSHPVSTVDRFVLTNYHEVMSKLFSLQGRTTRMYATTGQRTEIVLAAEREDAKTSKKISVENCDRYHLYVFSEKPGDADDDTTLKFLVKKLGEISGCAVSSRPFSDGTRGLLLDTEPTVSFIEDDWWIFNPSTPLCVRGILDTLDDREDMRIRVNTDGQIILSKVKYDPKEENTTMSTSPMNIKLDSDVFSIQLGADSCIIFREFPPSAMANNQVDPVVCVWEQDILIEFTTDPEQFAVTSEVLSTILGTWRSVIMKNDVSDKTAIVISGWRPAVSPEWCLYDTHKKIEEMKAKLLTVEDPYKRAVV